MDRVEHQHEAALLARRTLSHPHAARLLVDGLTPTGSASLGVELVDRHGTPVLVCDPASPLAAASRAGREATLSLLGDESLATTVTLRGRLVPAGTDAVDDRAVELVELELSWVSVSDQEVSLETYLEEGGGIEAYAAAVLHHTNTVHAADLVGFVAGLSGTRRGDVAGATLSCLDPAGTSVRWVDVDGAHEVRVLFPVRATTCHQLGELVGQALCTHHG
jgi:hypothetical protein